MYFVIIIFLIGIVLGGFGGAWWAKRTLPASVFSEDSDEAEELRTEATNAVHVRIEKRKERIVGVARKDGRITNDGVEDMFCIGDATAGRYLRQLVNEGKLVKVGKTGRGVYYTVSLEDE